ncbi:hypothetical protein [Psychrobacillus sp. BM2]|uniref:hypothetical protein n=1 Tax=Psychrobacillus sp. BM2 TaxID=3400421 RepID=UPI003B01AAFE
MGDVNQISIVITDVNKPPTIIVGGINVAVVEFEQKYCTSNQHGKGVHRFLLKYFDGETIKTIGYERPFGNGE